MGDVVRLTQKYREEVTEALNHTHVPPNEVFMVIGFAGKDKVMLKKITELHLKREFFEHNFNLEKVACKYSRLAKLLFLDLSFEKSDR